MSDGNQTSARAFPPIAIHSRPIEADENSSSAKLSDLAFFALLLVQIIAFRSFVKLKLQIGADEGFEFAKLESVVSGNKLYTEIWNDQPPLLTALGAELCKIFGQSPVWLRLLGTASGVLLLGCLRPLISGVVARMLAAVFLLASPGYLELSASFMLELPVIAASLLSLAVISLLWVRGSVLACALSGLLFGIALNFKLIALIYEPIILLMAFSLELQSQAGSQKILVRLILFSAVSTTTFLIVGLLQSNGAFLLQLQQSWASHFTNAVSNELGSAADHKFEWMLLVRNWDLVIPGLIGVWILSRQAIFGMRGLEEAKGVGVAVARTPHPGPLLEGRGEGEKRKHRPAGALSWLTAIPNRQGIFGMRGLEEAKSVAVDRTPHPGPLLDGRGEGEKGGPCARRPLSWSPAGRIERGWREARRRGELKARIGATLLELFPVIWLVEMLLVFSVHKPWWGYYYVHIAVPLCWCAAVGFKAIFTEALRVLSPTGMLLHSSAEHQFLKRWAPRAAGAFLLLFASCCALWMGARFYLEIKDLRGLPKISTDLVIPEMQRYKPFVQFIYSSDPIYSFHADIPMVPSLAVMPLKRFWSGDMTLDKLTCELERSKPGLILLRNDEMVLFDDLLNSEYNLVFQDNKHRLYALRAVAKKVKW